MLERGASLELLHMKLLCHRHQPTNNKQEEIMKGRAIDRSTKGSSPHSHQHVSE